MGRFKLEDKLHRLRGRLGPNYFVMIALVQLASCAQTFAGSGSAGYFNNHQVQQQQQLNLANQQQQQHQQQHNQQPSERCTNGPPLQWRPHLDVAGKAHLAPIVALGSLEKIRIVPIQLGNSQIALSNLQQHVNNVGVNIEATFRVANILKKRVQTSLNLRQTIKLVYRVSASLSTTSALSSLISNAGNSSNQLGSEQQVSNSVEYQHRKELQQLLARQQAAANQPEVACALELSENELVKKAERMFKINQNYILFLDQRTASVQAPVGPGQQPQRFSMSPTSYNANKQQQVGAASLHVSNLATIRPTQWAQQPAELQQQTFWPHPFATHEPLTNQTGRTLRKILYKKWGKSASSSSSCSLYP